MPSQEQLQELADSAVQSSRVLLDESSPIFQEYLTRWSEIGRKIPSAIVLPRSENACQTVVRWAVANDTPFVVKSGGMSLYSSIGKEGIVIDLSDFASVVHDRHRHEAVLTGSIASKAVAVALAEDKSCTTLPSSNTVGAIPFFIQGGNSPLVAKLGYASDNIISARIVTSSGDLINVSETENEDLIYAIRGAGQFFGLITSLTVRTYPVEKVFGNSEGTFWSGRFVFSLDRAEEVAFAMKRIVNNESYCIGGLTMVAALPPTFNPALAVTAKLIHPGSDAIQGTVFRPLYDLNPMVAAGGQMRIENNADALQPLSAPGGFKKLRLTGIDAYSPSHVTQLVELWQELVSTCPSAKASSLGVLFESQSTPASLVDSANGMHALRFWANHMVHCRDAADVKAADHYIARAIDIVRTGLKEDEYIDFANSLRVPESPIAYRYRDRARLERLQSLKREWDGSGVFSRELLLK